MTEITTPCPRCGRLMRYNARRTGLICGGADVRVPSASNPYRLVPACTKTLPIPEDIRLRQGGAERLPGF